MQILRKTRKISHRHAFRKASPKQQQNKIADWWIKIQGGKFK
jgi:hypothetical protein